MILVSETMTDWKAIADQLAQAIRNVQDWDYQGGWFDLEEALAAYDASVPLTGTDEK